MTSFLKSITLRDLFLVGGFGSLIYGVSLLYVPAAWIVAGVLLMAASWKMAQTSSR
jgi:hypothetical protein